MKQKPHWAMEQMKILFASWILIIGIGTLVAQESAEGIDPVADHLGDMQAMPTTFILASVLIPIVVRLIRQNVLSKLSKRQMTLVGPIIGIVAEIACALMGAPQGGQLMGGGVASLGTHQIAKKWTRPDIGKRPANPTITGHR